MSECLHCDIGDLIEEHLKEEKPDLAQMASMIAQSLAEFILRARNMSKPT